MCSTHSNFDQRSVLFCDILPLNFQKKSTVHVTDLRPELPQYQTARSGRLWVRLALASLAVARSALARVLLLSGCFSIQPETLLNVYSSAASYIFLVFVFVKNLLL